MTSSLDWPQAETQDCTEEMKEAEGQKQFVSLFEEQCGRVESQVLGRRGGLVGRGMLVGRGVGIEVRRVGLWRMREVVEMVELSSWKEELEVGRRAKKRAEVVEMAAKKVTSLARTEQVVLLEVIERVVL